MRLVQPDLSEIYERGFRSLLWRLHPPELQNSVDRRLRKAEQLIATGARPCAAYERVYEATCEVVWHWLLRKARWSRSATRSSSDSTSDDRLPPLFRRRFPQRPFEQSPDFHCDVAMGGLARWLRGAGYDAAWWPAISDDELLRKIVASSAIMLTTDSVLMERGAIVRGLLPALLVPNTLKKRDQFIWVRRCLKLPLKEPRCMACGGRLRTVEKELVRDRIPPKTYVWLDEYLLCGRCNHLYWPGTHWRRIDDCLRHMNR